MDKFELIVLCALLSIFLIVILYFVFRMLFTKIKMFFYNLKLKKFNLLLNKISKDLKVGQYPKVEDIDEFKNILQKDNRIKEKYYFAVKELIEENINDKILQKFIEEINSCIVTSEDLSFEYSYSKELEVFIVKTNSFWTENKKVDEFLLKCLHSSSKKIRLQAINAIANRGNIASFTKAFVVACERLSDFTQREIYDALDKFKDKKMLNSVLVKLKEESENIRLKYIVKEYLA